MIKVLLFFLPLLLSLTAIATLILSSLISKNLAKFVAIAGPKNWSTVIVGMPKLTTIWGLVL